MQSLRPFTSCILKITKCRLISSVNSNHQYLHVCRTNSALTFWGEWGGRHILCCYGLFTCRRCWPAQTSGRSTKQRHAGKYDLSHNGYDLLLAIQQLYNNYTTTIQQPIQQLYNNCIFTMFRGRGEGQINTKTNSSLFSMHDARKPTNYELLYSCCIGCCIVVV